MFDDLLASVPTIAISIIAVLGIWLAVRGEYRRDMEREAQVRSVLMMEKRTRELEHNLSESERNLKKKADECDDYSELLARLEKSLADAMAKNRAYEEILSKTHSGGITVSGGTVNVHGDAVGGDEAKRDEYRAGGNVNQTKTNSGG